VSSPTPESRLAELARKATPGERKVTEQFVDWGFRTLMYVHVGPAAEEYDEAHVICWTRGGAAQCLGSDLKERALTDRARANMDFIAACDPATILRLVEENGRLRRAIEKAAADLDDAELGEGVQTNLPYIARDLDMALGKKPRTTYV
jgi:hypothetical protein